MTFPASTQRLRTAHQELLAHPTSTGHRDEFVSSSRASAIAASNLPRSPIGDPAIADAWELAIELASLPPYEIGTPTILRDQVSSLQGTKSARALAQALLVRPWETDRIPRFADLPDDLWGTYARWVFSHPPHLLVHPVDQKRLAEHLTIAAEDLAHWLERNRGSQAIRAATEVFIDIGRPLIELWPVTLCTRWQQARGRIIHLWHNLPRDPNTDAVAHLPEGQSRVIGVIGTARDTALDGFVRDSTLAMFSGTHGRVIRFLDQPEDGLLGVVLPVDLAGKCRMLREHNLDVLLFAPHTSTWNRELTALASVRNAPLQVAIGNVTTGLSAIDVILTSQEAAGAVTPFTERVAPTPFGVLCSPLATDQTPPEKFICKSFNLPADAVVAVAPVNPLVVSPTVREAIADALAAQPNLHLLISASSKLSTVELVAAEARWREALDARRVPLDQVRILSATNDNPETRTRLIRAADIWLELDYTGDLSLIATAATHQVPLLVWAQLSANLPRSARVLNTTSMFSAIVHDGEKLTENLALLAEDEALRQSEGMRLHHAFFDSQDLPDALAVAEVLGEVIEKCHTTLQKEGHRTFARETAVLIEDESYIDPTALIETGNNALTQGNADEASKIARSALRFHPQCSDARFLMGRALSALGHYERATTYLTAAIAGQEHDGARWLELAKTFKLAAELPHALDALGACLQVAPDCLEGWVMMVELANGAGSTEIAAEALEVAQRIAPNDPRVRQLAQAEGTTADANHDPFAAFASQ